MDAKKQKKINLGIVLAELFVLVCLIVGFAAKERMDEYYGDAYSEPAPIDGYEIALERGSYSIKLSYQADSDDITCYTVMTTSYGTLEGEQIILYKEQNEKEIEFRVPEYTDSFWLGVNVPENGAFDVSEVHLKENSQMDRSFCFTLALIFLLLDLLYYVKQKKIWENLPVEKKQVCVGLVVITLIALIPIYNNYLTRGHDFRFHLVRISGIAQALSQGQFPVRMQPIYLNDYGFPISVMYGDLFLYIPALLKIIGYSLQTAYKVYLALITAVTAWNAYYCAKDLSKSHKIGLFGSFIYTLSFYRLLDIYARNALGEYTALAFMPLIFLALYRIFHVDGKEKKKYGLLLLIGYTAILQSHILSFEMMILFSVLYCLLNMKLFWKNILFLVKTAVVTILVNLSFLVPFLDYMMTQDIVMHDETAETMRGHGMFLAQLFQTFSFGGYLSGWVDEGIIADMPIGIGLALVVVVILFVWQYFVYKKKLIEMVPKVQWSEQCRLCVLILLGIWMSCWFFPWNLLENIPGAGDYLASYQFPWRFLAIVSVLGTFLAVYVVQNVEHTVSTAAKNTTMLVLCIVTCVNAISLYDRIMANYVPVHVSGEAIFDTVAATAGQKFMLNDVDGNQTRDISVLSEEGISISDYQKTGCNIEMDLENTLSQDQNMLLPLFSYKGFVVKDRASGTKLSTFADEESKRLGVVVPAGYEGTLRIRFREPWLWRVAEVGTLAAILFLIWQMTDGFGGRFPKSKQSAKDTSSSHKKQNKK